MRNGSIVSDPKGKINIRVLSIKNSFCARHFIRCLDVEHVADLVFFLLCLLLFAPRVGYFSSIVVLSLSFLVLVCVGRIFFLSFVYEFLPFNKLINIRAVVKKSKCLGGLEWVKCEKGIELGLNRCLPCVIGSMLL